MKKGDNKEPPRRYETTLEASFRCPLETFTHQFLRKVEVLLLVGHNQLPLYITGNLNWQVPRSASSASAFSWPWRLVQDKIASPAPIPTVQYLKGKYGEGGQILSSTRGWVYDFPDMLNAAT